METISVRCNHCGAPLQISEGTRFVTCQFCHSSLEVKRTESSVFTEEVAKIAENTGRMAESLEVIELQNEFERIDREWAQEQSRYMVRDKKGASRPAGSIFRLAFSIFFALGCFSMAAFAAKGPGGLFAFIPAGMGVFVIVMGVMDMQRGQQLAEAEKKHQRRRAALLTSLQKARGEG